jgi:lysophospholipase L1-like esterase
MRTWLDGQGGSYSNTGNYANTNFAVLNAGNAEWALSPADGNQDLIFTVIPKAMQSISPNDPNIHISGAQYITRGTNSVSFQRHSDYVLGLSQAISRLNPLKARTTTGVILTFKTDSRTIEMSFRMLDFDNLDSGFGVYQDGVLIAEHTFVKDIANPDQILTITSVSPGTASVFEVVMPSKSNTELFGMRIGGDASLLSYTPPVRKKYVAFGDSITHGTGQEPYSHWIYPFKLSRELGVELFNIAVGGSQVSSVCGEMMADFPPVDVITILWGYNDWRANVSKVDYQTRMDDLIAAIRGHQATAEIFCITPTYSTNTNSPDGNTTLDDYRQAVADLVASRQAAGDSRIHTVRGEEIIYFATQLKDPVHLTPDGATDMANGLFTAMDPIVNPLTFAGWTTQKGLSGADTNYFADPDGDGINNLLEYATGGNPASTNDSPDIFRLNPAGWSAADTNGVEFTSRRQRYATAKGLIYQLERTDDLISGIWETNGVEETGTAMIDENYEWVSNRVVLSTNETGFVRMRISITP